MWDNKSHIDTACQTVCFCLSFLLPGGMVCKLSNVFKQRSRSLTLRFLLVLSTRVPWPEVQSCSCGAPWLPADAQTLNESLQIAASKAMGGMATWALEIGNPTAAHKLSRTWSPYGGLACRLRQGIVQTHSHAVRGFNQVSHTIVPSSLFSFKNILSEKAASILFRRHTTLNLSLIIVISRCCYHIPAQENHTYVNISKRTCMWVVPLPFRIMLIHALL